MPGTNADRTYLYVPPEEKAEVEALGAHWDDKSKCWYIGSGENAARFSKWLPDGAADEEFTITSDRAYVASTTVSCWECHAKIEAICIYCESGIVSRVVGAGSVDDDVRHEACRVAGDEGIVLADADA